MKHSIKNTRLNFMLAILMLVSSFACSSEQLYINDMGFQKSIPIKSWKTLRDDRIVKQDLDYSCGAASIATILNEYYGLTITEEEILKRMNKEDLRASFDDMANALAQLGFRGVGLAASFEQLTKLKIPVIIYAQYRKNDHFSVLRGIDKNTVWLADPSLGNRTYSKHQFLKMWETRHNSELKGKILAIIPANQSIAGAEDFFTQKPRRQTAQAIQQQEFLKL